MKASRLLSILMVLQTRGRSTASALARELEVSERTVLRDIDHLSAAGVPIWGERGRQGGLQLRPGWTTQLTGMTEDEASALLLAGMPGPATELGLGKAATSARLKLVASVPTPQRTSAATVAERLHIDPIDWYRTTDAAPHLRDVAAAVWRNQRIQVDYSSWRGRAHRELEPLGLVLKAGAWYLAARQTGQPEVRTYRLASMQSVSVTKATFKRPRGFNLAGFWAESARRFEADLRPMEATVLVSPRAMSWLLHARQRVTPLPHPPAGASTPPDWQCVSLGIESIEHGARQILSYGGEAIAIEPKALRKEVARLADVVQGRHRDG
ncbi:MAG: YafY family transcriptional regulator [Hydrogenophaga sp.]|uniref:helix-turn-helix transcriptional regulator n=1 Tax=Hydrogenophaga sp. TaxID=1904254 RepID=UPI001D904A29|nr:YafY family protein [Hydrogenophaga sp.]MBX3610500.1 YafY family transcriptional regulator [Hydrogenophaga sp.]